MNIRRIKIWLSRRWSHVVSGVTLLLLSLFCNSCKTTSAVNRSQVNTKDAVSVKRDTVALTQLTADMIDKVRRYPKESDLYRQTAYGPPELVRKVGRQNNKMVRKLEKQNKKERRKARRAEK